MTLLALVTYGRLGGHDVALTAALAAPAVAAVVVDAVIRRAGRAARAVVPASSERVVDEVVAPVGSVPRGS